MRTIFTQEEIAEFKRHPCVHMITPMHFASKKTSFVIPALTAIACSRALFSLLNDPEGPNLLIVMVMAAIIYFLSLMLCTRNLLVMGLKKLLLTIGVQMILLIGFYVCLR
jgi:hypothetical protein